jgi:hypothetical protein
MLLSYDNDDRDHQIWELYEPVQIFEVHSHSVYFVANLDEVVWSCNNQGMLLLFYKSVSSRSVNNNPMPLAVVKKSIA